MKEIKAYINVEFLNAVIERLEEAGAKDITVISVDAVGKLAEHETPHGRFWPKYDEKYAKIAKLEVVCLEENAETYMEIIQQAARVGESGDGRVFLTSIEKAVNIRTGKTGREAL